MEQSDIEQHEICMDDPLPLPANFSCHKIAETIVVVYPELARWLVFQHDLSLEILRLLTDGALPSTAVSELLKTNPESVVQTAFDELMTELIDKELWPEQKPTREFLPEYSMLTLTLTNACNLRCKTCYRYCGSREPSELPESRWFDILDEHISLGGRVLRISGGEPLFQHKELTLDLITKASRNGLKTLLLTNGTLLDIDTAQQLEAVGLDRIQISLDGPEESSNDSVRGRGVFKKVLNSIKNLRDTSIDLYIAVVPVPGLSLESLELGGGAFFRSLHDVLGRPLTVSVAQGILQGRSVKKQDDLTFIRRCRNLQDNISELNTSAGLDLWQWVPGRMNASCGIGCSLSVEPNGDVLQCAGGAVVASVRNKKLKAVISELREVALLNHVDSLDDCKSCDLRYLCGGPCRVDNEKCTEEKREEILKRLVAMNELRYDRIS